MPWKEATAVDERKAFLLACLHRDRCIGGNSRGRSCCSAIDTQRYESALEPDSQSVVFEAIKGTGDQAVTLKFGMGCRIHFDAPVDKVEITKRLPSRCLKRMTCFVVTS